MLRIAFIAGALALTLGCSRVVFVARNMDALFDGAEAADQLKSVAALVDFMDANRSHVSLVAYRADDPDAAILLNPDVPRPLASTIKILVLAGYAEAVDEGRWSPHERVPLTAVEAFLLPRTDGGAHDHAVEEFRERGWLDAPGNVALRDVVWAMMTVSDNSATDYLLHRLGREAAGALPARFAAPDSDAPLPISGVFLSWDSEEGPLADAAWGLAGRLHSDPGFRARRRNDPVTGRLTLPRTGPAQRDAVSQGHRARLRQPDGPGTARRTGFGSRVGHDARVPRMADGERLHSGASSARSAPRAAPCRAC